ncbi:MAG: discoidin domain-containing protein [Phycisphaeraceae bacterium]|nr:discoidin domain-containing protein [Phycisphaeraceae bacterium]
MLLCLSSSHAQIDPQSMVGAWLFDEGTGSLAKDGSGHGYDADLVDNPTWTQGIRGQGLEFQGGSYLEIRNSAENLAFGGTATFTITAWVKNQGGGTVLGKYNAGIIGAHFLQLDAAGIVGFDRESPPWIVYGSKALPSNEFGHVAATYDGTTLRIYVDGELDIEQDWGSQSTDTQTPVLIGARHSSGSPTEFFDGVIDEVAIFDVALTQEQIREIMKGLPMESKASAPIPEDETTDVVRDTSLSWTATDGAATHDVYFGMSWEDVNAAGADAPLDVLVSEGQVATTYTPEGVLAFGESYFWRIDEVNGAPDYTVTRGNIWSFQAEPYSIPIPGSTIAVTASSYPNQFSLPEKTIDGSGLGADNTHSMLADTMWFTAPVDLDPWIQFEFDAVKQLETMKIWNSNGVAEMAIGWGVKDVEIEYSADGENWTVLEGTSQLNRATGLPTYNQYDDIAFKGAAAKLVRLNIQSNWGGILMAYGLSEVQFSMIPTQVRSPEPASGSTDVHPHAMISWRAGRSAAQHTVYMGTDANAVAEGSAPSTSSSTSSLDLTALDLHLGETYYWRVDEVNEAEATPIWAGPVWSLSTPVALVLDDFESYNNLSPDRPFQAWLDGFGYSADEFFPTASPGNGTGSGVGHDIWSLSSPHFDGDIMESTAAHSGGLSLPFYYSNSDGTASQIDRQFAAPQDWSGNGIQTLVLYFLGSADNTGQLYAKINDTKIPYDGDASNLTKPRWNPWHIDLSALAVSQVSTLSIGVEGAGASGMLLLDDIRLHRSAPELMVPVEPSTDNLVAYWALDEGTGATVADSAGGNNGTIAGLASWITGHAGSALELNGGMTSYVNCGTPAAFNITEAITLSAWVYAAEPAESLRPIIGKGDHAYMLRHGSGETFDFFIYSSGAWHQISAFAPDSLYQDSWNHIAGTFDGSQLRLYINGMLATSLDYTGTISLADHDVNIGRNSEVIDRVYRGTIDEVRVYNSALTEAEVLYLSNE